MNYWVDGKRMNEKAERIWLKIAYAIWVTIALSIAIVLYMLFAPEPTAMEDEKAILGPLEVLNSRDDYELKLEYINKLYPGSTVCFGRDYTGIHVPEKYKNYDIVGKRHVPENHIGVSIISNNLVRGYTFLAVSRFVKLDGADHFNYACASAKHGLLKRDSSDRSNTLKEME